MKNTRDIWFVMIVIIAAGVAYAPMVETLFRLSGQAHQALNGLILLLITLAGSIRTLWRHQVPFYIRITPEGIVFLGVSALCLLAASFQELWPLAILAFCLNLAAILAFLYGRQGVHAFTPALIGLGLASFILILAPAVDGALRLLAARLSSSLLDLASIDVQPMLRPRSMEVVLVVGGGLRAFNVAAECNGFGLVFSSILLAAILSAHGHQNIFFLMYGVTIGLIVGVLFNALRIMAVVLTALKTSWDYKTIHEGWGTAIYALALILVFLLTNRRSRDLTPNGSTIPDVSPPRPDAR